MNRHYARKLLARFFSDFMKSRSPIVMASYRNRRDLLESFATYCVEFAVSDEPITRDDKMYNEHRDPSDADRIDLAEEDRRHAQYLADNPNCPAAVETRRRVAESIYHSDGVGPYIDGLECWRCGAEGRAVTLPTHPDGGGRICHVCWQRMFDETSPAFQAREAALEMSYAEVIAAEVAAGRMRQCSDGRYEIV